MCFAEHYRMAEEARKTYKPGQRVVLHEMKGESIPSGTQGTISRVDDCGQIHVRWDNGSGLALHLDEDSFQLLN